jgi:hypothetical protein
LQFEFRNHPTFSAKQCQNVIKALLAQASRLCYIKAMKPDIKKARKHFEILCELASKGKQPLAGMTKEQAIKAIRKTRKELWDKKIAARP